MFVPVRVSPARPRPRRATNIKSLQHASRDCKSHVAGISYTRRSRVPWGSVVVGWMVRVSMPAVSCVSNSVRAPSPSQSLPGVQSGLNHGNHTNHSPGVAFAACLPSHRMATPPRRGEGSSARRAASQVSTRASRVGMIRCRSRSFVSLADSSASQWGLTDRRAHSREESAGLTFFRHHLTGGPTNAGRQECPPHLLKPFLSLTARRRYDRRVSPMVIAKHVILSEVEDRIPKRVHCLC